MTKLKRSAGHSQSSKADAVSIPTSSLQVGSQRLCSPTMACWPRRQRCIVVHASACLQSCFSAWACISSLAGPSRQVNSTAGLCCLDACFPAPTRMPCIAAMLASKDTNCHVMAASPTVCIPNTALDHHETVSNLSSSSLLHAQSESASRFRACVCMSLVLQVGFPGVGRLVTNKAARMEFVFDPVLMDHFESDRYGINPEVRYTTPAEAACVPAHALWQHAFVVVDLSSPACM